MALFFYGVIGLLGLTGIVLQYVGMGMCILVPQRGDSSARTLAIAAFICMCVFLVFCMAWQIPQFTTFFLRSVPIWGMMSFNLLLWSIAIAGSVLWFMFLRALCLDLRGRDTADRVVSNLIAWIIFYPASFVLMLIMACAGGAAFASLARSGAGGGGPGALGAMVIFSVLIYGIFLVVALGLYIWYLFILQRVRGVIERHLARR
jgi:hypothetical protein